MLDGIRYHLIDGSFIAIARKSGLIRATKDLLNV
jgi:hypothetical protein